MTIPRAFISFDFDHNEQHKILFVGQGNLPTTPWEIADWSAKEAMPRSSTIIWTWPNVADAVNRMMKEGKNVQNEKSFNYWNR